MSAVDLAPYQLMSDDTHAWLENVKNGDRFFWALSTPRHRKNIRAQVAMYNSNYALNMLGVV